MRVGNVEVLVKGSELLVIVHGCTGGYYLSFGQDVNSPYDALLRQSDIYEALRRGRKDMQREVLDSLQRRDLPGVRRGRLARAIGAVRQIYGL